MFSTILHFEKSLKCTCDITPLYIYSILKIFFVFMVSSVEVDLLFIILFEQRLVFVGKPQADHRPRQTTVFLGKYIA